MNTESEHTGGRADGLIVAASDAVISDPNEHTHGKREDAASASLQGQDRPLIAASFNGATC